MAQKTRSKTALREPENVQMLTDKNPKVKKRGHSTDTEDAPRKKARNQHKVDGVSGKKVLYLLTITFKHSLADHDIQYIDQTK
jgi:hypothetical protein